MDFTFLELHLHDAEFNAPFAGGRSSNEADDASTAEPAADASEPASRAGPLVGLLAFVGLALVARYLRGGQAEQSTRDEVEA